MKSKFIIFILMFSSKSFAVNLGGVDVGNGHITPSLIETTAFDSEESLIEFGEVFLNSINYGIDPIAVSIASSGRCDLNRFKINKMNIEEFYLPVEKQTFSMKKFRAKILINFFNCKKPIAIISNNDKINGEKQ